MSFLEKRVNLNGPEVVNRLVEDNVKLAYYFAGKTGDIDQDQALSLALQGLQRAAELWDEAKGKFGTYASIHIKSAISRYRNYLAREKRGGKTFTVSLNDLVGEDSATELGDLIADESASATHALLISDDAKLFNKGLRRLTQREQYVIRCRFGIDDEQQTLEQVGNTLDLTRERIRQVEAAALEKLKTFIEKAPRIRKLEDKVLKKIRARRWYQKNKARISRRAKEYYRIYSKIVKARVREWYWSNRGRAMESALRYREAHRQVLAAKQLQRYHNKYKDDPAYKARCAAFRAKNRQRQRNYARNRSLSMTDGYIKELLSKKTGRPAFTFTTDEIQKHRESVIVRRNNPECPHCGTKSARSGIVKGRQRYFCWRGCKRAFFPQAELAIAA